MEVSVISTILLSDPGFRYADRQNLHNFTQFMDPLQPIHRPHPQEALFVSALALNNSLILSSSNADHLSSLSQFYFILEPLYKYRDNICGEYII